MAPASKKVDRETLDLIVKNIETAHKGTNDLIVEKFEAIGARVTKVETEQDSLAKKVYWLLGCAAAIEIMFAIFTKH